jgi:hypothetical protein
VISSQYLTFAGIIAKKLGFSLFSLIIAGKLRIKTGKFAGIPREICGNYKMKYSSVQLIVMFFGSFH